MGEVKINEGRLTVRQDLPYTYYFIPQVLLFHRHPACGVKIFVKGHAVGTVSSREIINRLPVKSFRLPYSSRHRNRRG